MSDRILLSICIATYNRKSHIQRQYEYFVKEMEEIEDGLVEVIISNNASQDGTEDFLRSIEGRYSWLVINQNDENIGCTRNLKLLLHMAKGDYFFLPGDDDYLKYGLVKYLVKLLQNKECTYVNLKTRWICEKTKVINLEGKVCPVPYEKFTNLTYAEIFGSLIHDYSNLKFQTSCVVLRELALQSEEEGNRLFTEAAINSNHSTFRSIRAMQQGKSFFTKEVWILGGDETTWREQVINEQSYDSEFILSLNKIGIQDKDCRKLYRRIAAYHIAGYMTCKDMRKRWRFAGHPGLHINIFPDLFYLGLRKLLRRIKLSNKFETVKIDSTLFGIETDSTVRN